MSPVNVLVSIPLSCEEGVLGTTTKNHKGTYLTYVHMHQKAFNEKFHANWLLILQKGLIQLNITYPKEEATI